jgi:purine-binding chemotaxis protein CheW
MIGTTTLEPARQKGDACKYITFVLGHESYGIPALQVREIIRLAPVTAIPQMPPHIKGVINLRGKIIPVTDLRARFGLAGTQDTERTCIIVVRVSAANAGQTFVGLIVDAVEEVANLTADEIEDTPDFGVGIDTSFILGMAKVKGGVKTLLEIDCLLSDTTATLANQSQKNTLSFTH